MQVNRFVELVDVVLSDLHAHKNSFMKNMEHLEGEDKKFSEWMMTYLAWSELGTTEDIERYYGHLDEEEHAS